MSQRTPKNLGGHLLRILLFPFSMLFGGITTIRNRLYDWGFFKSHAFDLPVISVGNLSVGGTGKTPHVELLIRSIQQRYQPAVLSRGYKRKTKGFLLADEHAQAQTIGDEPMQYRLNFPDLVVAVAEQRVLGIPRLLQAHPEVEVILLDDAFQHRRVKPGLQILLTSYDRPYTRDRMIPLGRLREPRAGAQRADIIIVSKAPAQLSEAERSRWIQALNPAPHQRVYFSTIRYGKPYLMGTRETVDLAGKDLFLVTGIAQPAVLRDYLATWGGRIQSQAYADHHDFSPKDIRGWHRLWSSGSSSGAKKDRYLVTTEKDAARLLRHRELLDSLGLVFAVIPMEVELIADHASFWKQVYDYIESYNPN